MADDAPLGQAADRLRRARRVVVLTGAGVSAESGVPTFRGDGGLWRNHRPEDLATPEAFARDPVTVWEWYAWRRELVARARPNPGHEALVRLESTTSDFTLVTQNVDGLHALAGNRRLLELHGSLWRVRCTGCGDEREDRRVPLPELPPRCPPCGEPMRPAVVWFGEPLPGAALSEGLRRAQECEVLVVAGTSAVVYPAAGVARAALEAGRTVIEVNPEATPLTPHVAFSLRGAAGVLLPQLISDRST